MAWWCSFSRWYFGPFDDSEMISSSEKAFESSTKRPECFLRRIDSATSRSFWLDHLEELDVDLHFVRELFDFGAEVEVEGGGGVLGEERPVAGQDLLHAHRVVVEEGLVDILLGRRREELVEGVWSAH